MDLWIYFIICYFQSTEPLSGGSAMEVVCRKRNSLYEATTGVVRAIMDMTKGVHEHADADHYVQYCKVGESG